MMAVGLVLVGGDLVLLRMILGGAPSQERWQDVYVCFSKYLAKSRLLTRTQRALPFGLCTRGSGLFFGGKYSFLPQMALGYPRLLP